VKNNIAVKRMKPPAGISSGKNPPDFFSAGHYNPSTSKLNNNYIMLNPDMNYRLRPALRQFFIIWLKRF
jgi:hypothetical protein